MASWSTASDEDVIREYARVTGGNVAAQSPSTQPSSAQLPSTQLSSTPGQYGPPAITTDDEALDWIWANVWSSQPGIGDFYRKNGWNLDSVEQQRAAIRNWITIANPDLKGLTPLQAAAKLGYGKSTAAPGPTPPAGIGEGAKPPDDSGNWNLVPLDTGEWVWFNNKTMQRVKLTYPTAPTQEKILGPGWYTSIIKWYEDFKRYTGRAPTEQEQNAALVQMTGATPEAAAEMYRRGAAAVQQTGQRASQGEQFRWMKELGQVNPGEAQMPWRVNPAVWNSLSESAKNVLLASAGAGNTESGVWTTADYLKQMYAARPRGSAKANVRFNWGGNKPLF